MIKILIVEDESIIARDISRELSKINDVTTVISDSFGGAIQAIDEIVPDLILLDIKLYEDETAGLRIAQYLNQKYRIPFIFLSGYTTEYYLKKAKKEMPITFLTKPIDNKQLQAAVLMAISEEQYSKFRSIKLKGRYIINLPEEAITNQVISHIQIGFENIDPDNIKVIKTFNHIKRNTVLISLSSGELFITNYTINEIMKLLPRNFIKVHSSFIINKDFITGAIGNTAIKIGSETITFGSNFKKQKQIKILNYFNFRYQKNNL